MEIPGVHSNADLQANLWLAESEEGDDKGVDEWDMQQSNWKCLGFLKAKCYQGSSAAQTIWILYKAYYLDKKEVSPEGTQDKTRSWSLQADFWEPLKHHKITVSTLCAGLMFGLCTNALQLPADVPMTVMSWKELIMWCWGSHIACLQKNNKKRKQPPAVHYCIKTCLTHWHKEKKKSWQINKANVLPCDHTAFTNAHKHSILHVGGQP